MNSVVTLNQGAPFIDPSQESFSNHNNFLDDDLEEKKEQQKDDSKIKFAKTEKTSTVPSAKLKLSSRNAHGHYAGRLPVGSCQPITLSKNGIRHIQLLPTGQKREILAVGLACSECFSGPRLAKLLLPGLEYEQQVFRNLMDGTHASPLSIHTSSGVPAALDEFIEALEPHLPWEHTDTDWCVSLQLEGASAVWAAVDMLLQLQGLSGNHNKIKVAVGERAYHGPPSSSCGPRQPLWAKNYQLLYPVPTPNDIEEEKFVSEFSLFLDKHADEIGVLLIEPQWGSSQAAFPWPQDLLKKYISMAHNHGIFVCSDEIMCGLGRHGNGTIFLSTAWELDVDAITFGKAIAGGLYPLSGAVIKSGACALGRAGKTVIQSHTFAGSSVRALMTATEVIRTLPIWFESISTLGNEMRRIFKYLSVKSDGMLSAHGQGLMWGCLFDKIGKHKNDIALQQTISCFRKHCEDVGVIPYFIPAGGFMVTPLLDIDVGTIYEIGDKFEEVILRTKKEVGWNMTTFHENSM